MLIFGKKVPIRIDKNLAAEKGLLGYFDPMASEIVVDGSLKGRDLLQTLLHEIDHALSHRIGLFQARISHDVHEIKAETFTTLIVENLTDKEVKALTRRLLKN